MLELFPHERAALECGPVLLLRPVEPQVERGYDGFGLRWKCQSFLSGQEDWMLPHCPLGCPGDVLATDAGPVRVVSVRVVRCAELQEEDVWAWGTPCIYCRSPLGEGCRCALADADYHQDAARLWATLYPAHQWEQAWCWAVQMTKGGE